MDQFFSHYENWEDYKNGMYEINNIKDKHKKVIGAISVLTDPNYFYSILNNVVCEWSVATKVNLTNISQNRRAWLGAAACCYEHKTPEHLTRIAWNLINKEDQDKANEIAEKIITEYEQKNSNQHAQTLFEY